MPDEFVPRYCENNPAWFPLGILWLSREAGPNVRILRNAIAQAKGKSVTPEIAKFAIEFMNRVQLQGAEVPAFGAVMNELHKLANPQPADTTGDKLKSVA